MIQVDHPHSWRAQWTEPQGTTHGYSAGDGGDEAAQSSGGAVAILILRVAPAGPVFCGLREWSGSDLGTVSLLTSLMTLILGRLRCSEYQGVSHC